MLLLAAGTMVEVRRVAVAARIAAIFLLLGIGSVQAGDADAPARLKLITAVNAHTGEPFLIGLRMELAPGWHTYWRVPGDSGIAPKFDWSASRNVASVDLRWPVPERFDAPYDSTFGYAREVVWPVLVRAKDAAKPVTLGLKFSYGVCSNICVPGEASLSLSVPASTRPAPTSRAETIRHYLARVPVEPADPSVLSARLDGATLRVAYRAQGAVPQLIVEGPKGIWFGEPKATQTDAMIEYAVPFEAQKNATLKGAQVVLTLSGPETAIEAVRPVE